MRELISTLKKKKKKKAQAGNERVEHSPKILAGEEKATITLIYTTRLYLRLVLFIEGLWSLELYCSHLDGTSPGQMLVFVLMSFGK